LHETAQKVSPEAMVLQKQSAVVLLLQMIHTLLCEQKLRIPVMWILNNCDRTDEEMQGKTIKNRYKNSNIKNTT
jgi:hypothetical protein